MKMTLVSVTSSWLCATGVAVISSYCLMTHSNGTAADQKKAAQVAYRVSRRGTIPEYKSTNRHSCRHLFRTRFILRSQMR